MHDFTCVWRKYTLPHAPSSSSIDWRAPASIFGGLLADITLAFRQHLFNWSPAGRNGPTNDHRLLGLPRERINTIGRTALAFLVKTCSTFTMSVAYYQLVWRSVKHRERATKVSNPDALFMSTTGAASPSFMLSGHQSWTDQFILAQLEE